MILLIEHNKRDEAWTQTLLSKNHILNPIYVAADGEAALQLLLQSNNGGKPFIPDFILIASNAPKVDAVEFVKLARASTRSRDIPIIILCATREELDRVSRIDAHRVFSIAKPLGFYKLIEALQKLEMFWSIHNQPPAIVG